jgi:hypothetical protein
MVKLKLFWLFMSHLYFMNALPAPQLPEFQMQPSQFEISTTLEGLSENQASPLDIKALNINAKRLLGDRLQTSVDEIEVQTE